jgi:hypothetical protein
MKADWHGWIPETDVIKDLLPFNCATALVIASVGVMACRSGPALEHSEHITLVWI